MRMWFIKRRERWRKAMSHRTWGNMVRIADFRI